MVTSLARRPGIGYRPELDGLRALAILAVLVFHTHIWFRELPVESGTLGVDLFFVLSGFLITTLLVDEHHATGRVDKKRFCARRALRILPALGLALGVGAIATYVVGNNGTGFAYPKAAIVALAFAGNWFSLELGSIAHTWSLGLEEQYYLVWPFVLAAVMRRGVKASRIVNGLLFAAAGITLLRSSYYHINDMAPQSVWAFVYPLSRADGVLIGSALGLFVCFHNDVARRLLRDRVLAGVAIAGVVVIAIRSAHLSPTLTDTVLPANLCFAVLIGHIYCDPTAPLARILRVPPLPQLGKISYGLYIFHYPIFFALRRTVDHDLAAAAMALTLSFAIALVSYFAVERPVLRLKSRIGSRRERTSSSAEDSSLRHPDSRPAPAHRERAFATP